MTAVEQPDLRAITDADVYIDDALSGKLTRQSQDSITFDYLPAEPSTESSVRDRSVSWSLLRTDEYPRTATGGAVPPFFAGLLPEGVRLGVVTSSTKTSADDHLTLLLAVGADTIGNVRVVPAGIPPPARLPMFQPDRDNDFRAVYAKLTGSVDADPVGLAGVQPKVSALTWSTTTHTSAGPAILKLGPAQFPLLVENEHFFMRMAAACGLRVSRTSVIHDANGHSALMVTRFDRDRETRIAQEDACQVDGIYPASKYRIKTETAINTLADACARGGGSKATAVLELLKTVVFSWLIGNGDLHGKNLSIYKPRGIWQPTPAYDLLTTQPYAGWKDPMALNLFGRANKLDRAHFLYAAEQLGLRSRAPSKMIDSVVHAAGEWPDRCAEIGFDTRQTQLLADMLRARIETLK
jgi:serine/threonine-protein kinase HipA